MSTRHLEAFFQPRSIVVAGASENPHNLGGDVLRNILAGGFAGALTVLNRKDYAQVLGVACYQTVAELPQSPELAVICTPPETVPGLVRQFGQIGVKAALVLMGGLSRLQSRSGRPLKESALDAAKFYGVRLLGPNSLGVLVPGQRLNASAAHLDITSGKVAFVGESGILGAAMIDWAQGRGIGFSHFLTLGDSVDVDFADVIDYLASDPYTTAILLHIERIRTARRFISAVRAASRGKLVLAIKSARVLAAQDPPEIVAPGLRDNDAVYDAVLRRAGALRVDSSDELFAALETLSRARPLHGERLAIMANGVGPGVLATDALVRGGGTLAELNNTTVERLTPLLPPFCPARNPLDLDADATPERYLEVFKLLTADRGVDAVLLMHVPTRHCASLDVAQAILPHAKRTSLNVLTSWIGQHSVESARRACAEVGVPTYETPEEAVRAFMHMVNHRRNHDILLQTPPPLPDTALDRRQVEKMLATAQAEQRAYLTTGEARAVVAAYGVPVVATRQCPPHLDAAAALFEQFVPPVALKIVHEAHCRPYAATDPGQDRWRSVTLNLTTARQVRDAAARMRDWVEHQFPGSRVLGYVMQPMQAGLRAVQTHIGITRDPTFGPLVLFGMGGPRTSPDGRRRLGLPPLNLALARDMLRESFVFEALRAQNHDPEFYAERLGQLLVRLSQLVIDFPKIQNVEINPLLLDQAGLHALDATVDLGPPAALIVSPYPEHLRQWITLKNDQRVELRPIRGEDEPAHLALHERLTPQAIRYRFFLPRKQFSHKELAQMTQIDYDREMVFIAEAASAGGALETLGEVRVWIDADNLQADYAITVRDDLQGTGLGKALMRKIIDYCRARGTLEIIGTVLPDNEPMLGLLKRLGFDTFYDPMEETVEVKLPLHAPTEQWQRQRLGRR